MQFASFHMLSYFMEGVESIESDSLFNEFIFKAIRDRNEGIRQFILGNQLYKVEVSRDDYPLESIMARFLQSDRVNLSNPPKDIVETILHETNLDIYKMYIAAKFNPSKYGVKPLLDAGTTGIFEYLLSNGIVDINATDANGQTVLINLCKVYRHENLPLIELLYNHGVDIRLIDHDGHDAVYYLEKQLTKFYGEYCELIKSTVDLLKKWGYILNHANLCQDTDW